MNCPHCNKVIVVKIMKDSNVGDAMSGTGMVGKIGALLAEIDDSDLRGKAAEFVETTRERYGRHGEQITLSEKQMSWLGDLARGEGQS